MANFDYSITVEKDSDYFTIFGPTMPIHKFDIFRRTFYHYPLPNGVVVVKIKNRMGQRKHIIQISNKSTFIVKVVVIVASKKERIIVKILKPNEVFRPNCTRASARYSMIAMRHYKKEQ